MRHFALLAAVLGVGLIVLHITQVLRLQAPQIFTDEGGYLANARYMVSGYGRTGSGYASGYSLLLVPAALFTTAPIRFYHAALVTNAVLSVISPLLALMLVRTLQPKSGRWVALVTAALVAFAPLAFYFVGLTMSENALLPATLAAALLLARAAVRDERWARLGAAAAGAFAYWTSPRGIIVTAATLVALAWLTFDERRSFLSLLPEVGTIAVAAFVGKVFTRAVNGTSNTAGYGGLTQGITSVVKHPGLWSHWLGAVLGRFAYLGVASAGLTIVGLVVSIGWLVGRRPAPDDALQRARRSVAVFAVLSIVVTVLADAARVAGISKFDRIDHLYFGRYNEVLALPALVIGASWMLSHARRRRGLGVVVVVGGGLFVALGLVRVLIPHPPPNHPVMAAAVPAWIPLNWFLNLDTLPSALLAGAAIATLALALLWVEPRVFGIVLVVVIAPAVAVSHIRNLEPPSVGSAARGTLSHAIEALGKQGVPTKCAEFEQVPNVGDLLWEEYDYRFLVPKTTFVHAPNGPNPKCGPLVISSGLSYATRNPAARLVALENYSNLTLWLDTSRVSPTLRAKVAQAGLLTPNNPCTALPAAAYQAPITATVTLAPGQNVSTTIVDISVAHAGAGAPWLASLGTLNANRCGQVDLIASVFDEAQQPVYVRTIPLPRTVLPGDTVHVREPLADPKLGPKTFTLRANHAYSVRIALVQQGVRVFGGPRGTGVVQALHT
jgi:hypothetical protein